MTSAHGRGGAPPTQSPAATPPSTLARSADHEWCEVQTPSDAVIGNSAASTGLVCSTVNASFT